MNEVNKKILDSIKEKIENMTIEELTEELIKYGVEFTEVDKK